MSARRTLLTILIAGCGAQLPAQGLPPVTYPAGNSRTNEKVLLGKTLFWDEQLSSTRTVACGTCHIPSAGSTDPRSFTDPTSVHPGPDAVFGNADDIGGSFGVPSNLPAGHRLPSVWGVRNQVTPRHTQSVIMAQYGPSLFWDGRASDVFHDPITSAVLIAQDAALEEQALAPFTNEVEMGHLGRTINEVVQRALVVRPLAVASNLPGPLVVFVQGKSYLDLFEIAFGSRQITPARIALALATYERELVPDQSPFDLGTMSGQAQGGEFVFNQVGRCALCHIPPLFTDNNFVNTGVRPDAEDLGRAIVTGLPADDGAFRMPSLRNVALRAPFFHNGRMRTLADVVDFYDRGGDFNTANLAITPIGLSAQQKLDLVAFLQALTDPRVANELPPFDRPTLFSESNRVPTTFGAGSPGDGGFVPRVIANEPPVIGNDRWTVALDNAPPVVPVWLFLGLTSNPAGIDVLGATFLLMPGPDLIGFQAGVTGGALPGEGTHDFTFGMPNQTGLRGLTLFGQWWMFNLTAPNPFAASPGFAFTLF